MGTLHVPWYSVSSQSATSTSWNADDGQAPHIGGAAPFCGVEVEAEKLLTDKFKLTLRKLGLN